MNSFDKKKLNVKIRYAVCAAILIVISMLVCLMISKLCTISDNEDLESINKNQLTKVSNLTERAANQIDQIDTNEMDFVGNTESAQEALANPVNNLESFKKHRNFKIFNNKKCGIHTGDVKIIGGDKTKILANPWMVAIVYNNTKTNTTSVDCAGTLISENIVLTAAHCVRDKKPIAIRLGDYNLNTDPDCTTDDYNETTCADNLQIITDFKILQHEYYFFRGFEDIALIKLNVAANLEHNNINTICLPFHDEEKPISRFYITGWGRIYNNATHSDVLLGAFVPFVANEECKKFFSSTLTKGHICAGGEGISDSCKGDSGGPLTTLQHYEGRVKTYQFGIVSYGPKVCGSAPGVYTKIKHYLRWILDNADV